MRLAHMPWPEAEALFAERPCAIVPIGSVEQHGPTGAIGTDAICAEAAAVRAAEIARIPVTPVLAYGMALHHMGFAGTVALRPTTLIALVVDVVLSLATHGVTRVFFVNGHGGNEATLSAAFHESYAEAAARGLPAAADLRCRGMSWWEAPGVMRDIERRFPSGHGGHATPSELSIVAHLHPDAVRSVPEGGLSPKIAPRGRTFGAAAFRKAFPDGRMGSDPSLATPDHGAALLEMAAGGLADAAVAFAAE